MILYFVNGEPKAKLVGKILTVLKGSVQIINITNPEGKITQCKTPNLEEHSLFNSLFPVTIKDKIVVGVAFDYEIYIFLKSNESQKYDNFKKIENLGTLSDYFMYKNYLVSYGFEEFHYYDTGKNFVLETYDKLKSEEINIETFLLFKDYRMKIQINDRIFNIPF